MKLNEAALAALLESQDGPVGREVARRAEEIVSLARANAAIIMHRKPEVVEAIDYEQHGTKAVIGIRDEGSIARYLSEKELREGVILRAALGKTSLRSGGGTASVRSTQ